MSTWDDQYINTRDLCELLQISRSRLSQLTKNNTIPKEGRGQFHLGRAVRGYIDHMREQAAGRSGLDLSEERAREARAKADKLELELEEQAGNLVRVDDMQEVLEQVFANIKAHLTGIPSAIKTGNEDPGEIVKRVLEDLANGATVENVKKRGREK